MLALVRGGHAVVYLVMVVAILVLLYAGVTAHAGPWLWVALGLLAAEATVFVGNRVQVPVDGARRPLRGGERPRFRHVPPG